jgi:hypothetical protein
MDMDGKDIEQKKHPQLIPFSKENQPTSEAKKIGWQKRREFLDSMDIFLSERTRIIKINGVNFQLTKQDEIINKLIQEATNGNLKAVELLSKMIPNWVASQKIENFNTDIPFKVLTVFEDYRINKTNDLNNKLNNDVRTDMELE